MEKAKTTEVPMDNLMKTKLADMVMNLGKNRGMNTQELVAIKSALKKNKLDVNEMMGMLMMKKMMGDDGGKKMQPMEMMMMMQMMNSGGSKESEYQKKIENLQKQMVDERKTSELKGELSKLAEKIKDSKGGDFGIKEMMAMWAERDRSNDKWRSENDNLKNQIMMKEVSGAIGSIGEEVKKLKESGVGGLDSIGKAVGTVKKLSEDLGWNKKQEKGKGELAKDLIENTVKALAPAINKGVSAMSSNPGNPGLTPDQTQRIQQIQANRQTQQAPQSMEVPTAESPVEPKKNYYIDDNGHRVYPSLLSLSEDKKRKE